MLLLVEPLLLSSVLLDSLLRTDGADYDTVGALVSVGAAVGSAVVDAAHVMWHVALSLFVHDSLHMLQLVVLL